MNHKERLKSYDELPLVLNVADIQRVMGISRASAYELVHSPGFPSFRSGRLIKVSKRAFFDWMAQSREKVGAP
ncbi:MAG: helix-turn-helix domain-containing protein [Oscillospiraceae bacterium]|nr:helix-turn-helix domain-containing protein [Oscillospiraceae bacterium]